jgi:hypothetical protein
MKLSDNPKQILYITISVVIVAFVLWFVVKRYIKNRKPPQIDIPDDLGSNNNYNPTAMTDALFNAIQGMSVYDNTSIYQQFNSLSDNEMALVMNDWDKRYFSKWNQTLFQAFSKEYFWFTNKTLMNSIYKRLEKLEQLRKQR